MEHNLGDLGAGRRAKRTLPLPIYDAQGLVVDYGVEVDVTTWDLLDAPPLRDGDSVTFTTEHAVE